jgi:predicted outer membrane repeat protein
VSGCAFSGNTAADDGGGVFDYSASTSASRCIFSGNHAGGRGGGMNGGGDVTACAFEGNSADSGGGLYSGGAAVVSSVFRGNSATDGGGMLALGSPAVIGCSFSGNTAADRGGAIFYNGLPAVTNCVFWNDAATDGGELYGMPSTEPVPPTVTYSDVQGGCTVASGCTADETGNLDLDPLFVDAAGGDLRLQAGSPCVDAGDTGALPADLADLDDDGDTAEATPLDLAVDARVAGASVDIGAYELE